MLLVSLSLGTLVFGMAMTVVNVILPQIQGSLSATQDQVAWVVTFHIIAVAIDPIDWLDIGETRQAPFHDFEHRRVHVHNCPVRCIGQLA